MGRVRALCRGTGAQGAGSKDTYPAPSRQPANCQPANPPIDPHTVPPCYEYCRCVPSMCHTTLYLPYFMPEYAAYNMTCVLHHGGAEVVLVVPDLVSSSRILLFCPALHRIAQAIICSCFVFSPFYFFLLTQYMGRLPQLPSSPSTPSKPCSRAGHDTETPTGLGTHKSARACYVCRLNPPP